MNWKNININKQNIKAETNKSVLISMPHKSKYNGFDFWHSAKLIRAGRHSNAISVGYTDDFKFKLYKYGKGRYNSRDVIEEIEINVDEFEKAFGVTDENIVASKKDTDSYLIVKEPEKVNINITINEDLKNE